MDKSGRPFKTRDGGTVKLIDLLDEAIKRAKETIQDRDISNQDLEKVAKATWNWSCKICRFKC